MGTVCNSDNRDTNQWAETIIIELAQPLPPSKIKLSTTIPLELPTLHPNVLEIRNQKKPFETELLKHTPNFQIRHYASKDVYNGQLSEEKPEGLGELYRPDGSLVIGYFTKGVLNGQAAYITPEPLYCRGEAVNGMLNCPKGILQTPRFQYVGGFKDNTFDGEGTLSGDDCKFQGLFSSGRKLSGKIEWTEPRGLYCYEGKFDSHQQFDDNGKLSEPYGEYVGSFKHGQKHGYGTYTYHSGIVYEGEYQHGQRNGNGKLTKHGKPTYVGTFKNGLPHGEGTSYGEDGQKRGNFIEGILQEEL